MKRILSLLLTIIMLFSLVACCGEQSPDADNDQGAASIPKYDYEANNLESMLVFIATTGETACADTTEESEVLFVKLGETYDTYNANKIEITAFFAAAQTRSAEMYDAFQSCSVDYFKCVADQGLDDYDAWNDAMGEFYDEWDDAMGDYYDAWDDAYGDIYDLCDELISDASDELDYDDYSDAWSAMYEEYSEAWSTMYDLYSDAWSKIYEDYSACWSGFYKGESDMDAILAATVVENSGDDDEDSEDDETSSDDDSAVSDTSYEDIEEKVQAEAEDALTTLAAEWEALAEGIDSYETYMAKVTAIRDFYDKVNNVSAALCIQMCQYSVDYAEAILVSGRSTDDMYADLKGIYDVIYDDAGGEIYDGIYDGILDEMYDAFYGGALDDRPDGVEYSDWSGARSNEYTMWSETRSDTYEQWSDFRGDVYEFWSDMRSEMYSDDIEAAQDELNDFREDVSKRADKLSSDEKITEETTDDTSVEEDIDSSFKTAMDNYEKFFDEYVIFMKEYKESDDIAGMANEYTVMMTRYLETMTALQEIDQDTLSKDDALYYTEVMLRISQKLLQVT